MVDGAVITKPAQLITHDSRAAIEVHPQYVSRGGIKLAELIGSTGLEVSGAHCLDVGASTGGFTDCLLRHGAASATCVDVGTGQLSAALKKDARVTLLEKLNARYLTSRDLPRDLYDIIVVDISFISLKKVLPALWPLLVSEGHLIALVKPQFEAGKAAVKRGRGIITSAEVQREAIDRILEFAASNLAGSTIFCKQESCLRGGDGNREFFLGIYKSSIIDEP